MGLFIDRVEAQADAGKFVCVGLDPSAEKILGTDYQTQFSIDDTMESIYEFLVSVVQATGDLVGAFKPNKAFFEAFGSRGVLKLEEIVFFIRSYYPDVVVILDDKRADIDNTNLGFASFAFEILDCDAITVHPYMGRAALSPLLDLEDRGVIVLIRTSNKGADELQSLTVDLSDDCRRWGLVRPGFDPDNIHFPKGMPHVPLYRAVAEHVVRDWNYNGNCGGVVGATIDTNELSEIRRVMGDMLILIPGVGAQGGDLEMAVRSGQNSQGRGFLINASRSVLYNGHAPKSPEEMRAEVEQMNASIRRALLPVGNDI